MPQSTDFQFTAGELEADDLRVLRYTGSEGISQCFVYDLDIATFDTQIKLEDIVGEAGHLVVTTAFGERHVDGVIARWEEVGRGKEVTYYTARLVPRVWTLNLIRQSRIFQNMSTPDILKAALDAAGIPSDEYRFSLQGKYEKRIYCVQYRETDFDFVCRLMEEEGMFFFFEHTESSHAMVVGDSPDAHQELPDGAEIRYREADSGMLGLEQVLHYRYARSLRPGAVTLKEFDFKKPTLLLKSSQKGGSDKESKFESYDYPGEYHVPSLGDRLAKVRLEEERAESYLGLGETDCRRFEPGYKFTLADHPNDALNAEYLLVRVRHVGEQPHASFGGGGGGAEGKTIVYRATFECIPSEVSYRAARVTPRPRVDGPQTAVVVGPSGEEIHCDEHGRVKVKFHWDRTDGKDDKVSCWIRVTQAWGGAGWGAMFIPRVGQEVVVDFLEGDPDRPLIVGRVYNGTSPPPYDLPAQKATSSIKSSSTPGGSGSNEIRMVDTGGSEEFYVHGQKDMNVLIENDRSEKIKNNETAEIDANRSVTVGGDQYEKIKGNDKTEITGDRDEKVSGTQTMEVDGDLKEKIGGKHEFKTGSDQTVTIGAKREETITSGYTLKVGTNLEVKAGSKISETTMKKEETVAVTSSETVGASKKISSAGQIKLESAMIKVDGAIVKIGAQGQLGLQGGMVQIQGSTMIKLEAGGSSLMLGPGIVQIQTSGIVMVNGSIIMLN